MCPSELEAQNAELRRIQAELQASRNRYFRLYDLAPTGYLTMDRNMGILEVNMAGAEMLRYHRDDIIGRPIGDFIAQPDLPILSLHRNAILEHRGKATCELRLSVRNEISWIRLVSTPLFDSLGTSKPYVNLKSGTREPAANVSTALNNSEKRIKNIPG